MVVSDQELLNPKEQEAVLQDIALVLAHNLPPGWQECLAVHGAVGAHAETTVRIERLNGPPTDVSGPEVLGELFARLRTGMYRPGVGTWFTARFRLTHPVDYRIEYDNTGRPDWSTPPPPEAYVGELRTFPRDPEHVPDWLRHSAEDTVEDRSVGRDAPPAGPADASAGGPADAAVPRFQMARLFDALGPGETPQVNRPPVPDEEVEAVADYLTKAPLVLAARSLDNDLLDPARPERVPLTYLTDGTWIWPGGVGYYLRTHGVPPEPELVEHIRSQGFRPPEIDDYTRDVAIAAIMGQPPPPRPAPQTTAEAPADAAVRSEPAGPEEPAPAKPATEQSAPRQTGPAEAASAQPAGAEAMLGQATPGTVPPTQDATPVAATAADAMPAAGTPAAATASEVTPAAATPSDATAVDPMPVAATPGDAMPRDATPADATPADAMPAEGASADAAAAAGTPADATPGVAPSRAPGPAAAQPTPVVTAVPDGDLRALDRLRARLAELGVDPESYGVEIIVDNAWCLVREGDGWAVFRTAGGDRAVSLPFPAADQAAAFLLGSLLMTAGRPLPPQAVAPPATKPDLRRPARAYDGPIEPLAGEPPVTLFRNLRESELVAGTEVDRVGDPEGNLTYAAGTHYSQRSLPPEWADRPYHVYRIQQPLRVLMGTAVPWFEQPGGGTGYFLPVSLVELLADGAVVEIEPAPKRDRTS